MVIACALGGTANADKGTANADKGTANADKGTANADKGMVRRRQGFAAHKRVGIVLCGGNVDLRPLWEHYATTTQP